MLLKVDFAALSVAPLKLAILAYLGIVASGLGFFLWNFGASRVAPARLAVMNNAKVPLAVACSLVVFGDAIEWPRLLASSALLGVAVWVSGLQITERK
jgi:drug/metabolite transporter (DMT)-like permease